MKPKLLLWLDTFSAQFGMSKWLQEDCDIYAIIDVNEGKEFYEKQNIVNFKNKWYLRDCFDKSQKKPNLEYLAKIEKKYRLNIWKIVYSDINFYNYNPYYKFNYDEILTIIEQECKFFEKVLDNSKPDYLAIRITDLSNGQILKQMCLSKGIEILMLGFTRFGNRGYISHEYDYLDFEKKHNEEEIKSYDELHKEIKGNTELQSEFREKFRNSRNVWIEGAIKYLSLIINNKYRKNYTNYGKTLSKVISRESLFPLKRRYRQSFINKNLEQKVQYNQNFIYFPLQLEPERSTLIPATFYTNQIEVITNIAKALPVDYQLFVKEHPMQKITGWHEIDFYKKIMELPNVRLIHPSISNNEILKKCKMAITIAGTTGLEAALNEKPCIVFADVIYSSLPSVYRLKSLEELPIAIKESLKKEVKLSDVNEFTNLLNTNSFMFNNTDLSIKINNEFFYDGYLFDTKINLKKAEDFIIKNQEYFKILSIKHLEKIKESAKQKDKELKKNER
jgi:hypothetical protein